MKLECGNCGEPLKVSDDFSIKNGYAEHLGVCPKYAGPAPEPPADLGRYEHCGQCGDPVDISQRGNSVIFDSFAYCRQCLIDGLKIMPEPDNQPGPLPPVKRHQRNGSPHFIKLLDKMRDIHERKNADYSPGADPFRNFRSSEKINIPAYAGAWVRLQDKYERCCSLLARLDEMGATNPAVVDESLEDTLLDLANYALIVRCLYEEWLDNWDRSVAQHVEDGYFPAVEELRSTNR